MPLLGAVEQLLLYPWFFGENYNLASSWLFPHIVIACSMDDHILQVIMVVRMAIVLYPDLL